MEESRTDLDVYGYNPMFLWRSHLLTLDVYGCQLMLELGTNLFYKLNRWVELLFILVSS
jgi:hypothetical protein